MGIPSTYQMKTPNTAKTHKKRAHQTSHIRWIIWREEKMSEQEIGCTIRSFRHSFGCPIEMYIGKIGSWREMAIAIVTTMPDLN